MVHIRLEEMLQELEAEAHQNHVPIMLSDGIAYLVEYIQKNQIKQVLEIGSAIGYSAIKMALASDDVYVTTIERDHDRYVEAVRNIERFHLTDRIQIIEADALELALPKKTFDLIFIDAAKSQYIKFFEKFQSVLAPTGTIVSDNLAFHGLTHTTEPIQSRNLRQLVRKINNYIRFLEENEEFETQFLSIGDGIGISKRR